MMRRREFITLLSSAAAAWPVAALAQVPRARPLIAYLAAGRPGAVPLIPAVQEGLRDLGYVEGRNIDAVFRFAENRLDRMSDLAEQVVQLKPTVILAAAVVDAVAARRATSMIPIVSPALADP